MGKLFLQRCLLKKIKKKTKTLPKEELVLKLIKKKTISKTFPKEELVYCFKCMLLAVRHSDAIPKTKDGTVLNWLCDQCESETGGSRAGVTNPGLFREVMQPVSYAEPLIRSLWAGMFDKDPRAGVTYPGLCREEVQPVSFAEPLIRSVWTGMLDVDDGLTFRVMPDVQAFLSSKACKKVHEAAALFRPALQLQMGPREKLWPKGFIDRSGPTDDSIAIYFFPSLAKQESYDKLVFEMLRDDLAMRASVGDAELLIFTSSVLPARFRWFQGRLFLWGVFRGKEVTVAV